jgi:putative peptidoglycan lipid II flippase
VSDGADGADGARPRIGAIAVLLAASVALSRVVGYVREIILANQLGAGAGTDAYYAAFQIPDVLNYLLAGGALTIAFVPFYSRVRRERGDAAAQRLFEIVLGTTGALAVLATVGLYAVAGDWVPRIFEHFDAATQQQTVELTRILLPAQIFFVVGGIVRAVLMVEGRFVTHAIAPIVYNLGIIVGGLATGTPQGFAWGALVGAFLGPLLLPVLDLRRTQRVAIRIEPLAPELRAYLWVALPLMLGLSLTTVDEWYEKYFGQAVGVGVVAYLGFARRLVQAPIAVVGQAIAVAALPSLTRFWAEGRTRELDQLLGAALRAALGLGVLAAAFGFVFAGPVVELIYHHGAFSAEAAARTASVLAMMSFAIPGWVAQQVGVRAFYAREEMWRAMLLGTGVVLAALPLYVALGERDGAEGLALAGAIAMGVNALATLGWARARFGGPALLPIADAFVRAGLIGAVAAAAARALAPSGVDKAGAVVELAVGGLVFAGVAGLGVAFVADAATRESIARGLRRLRLGR